MVDRSELNLPVYSPERRELKALVDTQVKSPPPIMKRRASMQNIIQIIPMSRKIETEDIDERIKTIQNLEDKKQKKLEWRAQYSELIEVVPKREKSEQ